MWPHQVGNARLRKDDRTVPTMLTRRRSFLLGLLAAGGLAAGGAAGLAGIANAQTAPPQPAASANAAANANETPGSEAADDTSNETGDAQDSNDPRPTDVKLSAGQASAAAIGAVPGTAAAPELQDEDGTAVWGMEVTKADGTQVEVKVDANSGTVLKQETGGSEGDKVG